jgi:hypothetical protein
VVDRILSQPPDDLVGVDVVPVFTLALPTAAGNLLDPIVRRAGEATTGRSSPSPMAPQSLAPTLGDRGVSQG